MLCTFHRILLINTTASQKNDKYKYEKSGVESKSFDIKSSDETSLSKSKTATLPIDYVSTPLLLKNKQEIESQKQQLQKSPDKELVKTKNTLTKFTAPNSLLNAKSAYESNSIMFSLFQKPNATLNQTPKIDETLALKTQEAKENNLRHLMVNTYIANDNYYKITA